MKVLIDGEEVECESIEFREDNLIVGASGAGGVHREINGSSMILIEDGILTASMAQYTPDGEENIGETTLSFDDLLESMGRTFIATKFRLDNKEWLEELENVFD
jgi:hypothetical protein